MASNPVRWFEIYVSDMARARRFYESVFGFSLSPLQDPTGVGEMWTFPWANDPNGAPGASGALVRMEGVSPGGGGTLVYFGCEDCAVEAGRVNGAGGTVARPKFAIGPHGHIVLVVDTEGNMIGLHSMA